MEAGFDVCGICLEQFSTDPKSDKAPVQGGCGHNACKSCVGKLRSKTRAKRLTSGRLRNIACPFCRASASFHWSKNVINFGLLTAIRTLRDGSSSSARTKTAPSTSECSIIVNVVKQLWADDVTVVTGGLNKLKEMCNGTTAVSHQNREDLSKCGGMLASIQAMKKFKDDVTLQTTALQALKMMTFRHDQNKLLACEVGGVEVTLAGMSRFADDTVVQRTGCCALRSFSAGVDNLRMIAKSGGIPTLIAAMKSHPANEAIARSVCIILSKLASLSEDDKLRIVAAGGPSAVGKALEDHFDNPRVKKKALEATAMLGKKARGDEVR